MNFTKRVHSSAPRWRLHTIVIILLFMSGTSGGHICLIEKSTNFEVHRQTCFGIRETRCGRLEGKAYSSRMMFITLQRLWRGGRCKPLQSRPTEKWPASHRSDHGIDNPQVFHMMTCISMRHLTSMAASRKAVYGVQQTTVSTMVFSLRQ